jgi:hypothetical protein
MCGRHFTYRDFVECGETWQRTRVDNAPRRPETYAAISDLCYFVLDRVVDQFGPIKLTYVFASAALDSLVHKKATPANTTRDRDQHAGCELNRNGKPYCPRLGQGVDFIVPGRGSLEVAQWILAHTPFDRLYFYSDTRPFHVSYGPEQTRYQQGLKRADRDSRITSATSCVAAAPHVHLLPSKRAWRCLGM